MTKQLILPRLPILFATGLLSTGLLLSGCSNDVDTEETVHKVEVADSHSATDDEKAADSEEVADSNKEATQQKSLVTNPTEAGTPEDTVKKALDSLYYGDVKQAAGYYEVDMANFEEELAKTQSAFQQTVEGVTITDTQYNDDKTRATITGELMLKGQSEPAPLTYELQEIDGQWKILG
ncbi:hypothetical protein DFP82_105232 [Psychrobacter fozii]|uniref:DUF4878 domain-containing protein n=2 Tax=Psychrobacter fozii TaxID=198480 RepID=A0A2V4V9E9_9GAMM|nr:hypothetical protein DFP82_105232 [Psychrobacter fozii]